jgi:hypothetical protein
VHEAPPRSSDRTVEIRAESGKKKTDRAGDEDDAVGCGVAPRLRTTWLDASSHLATDVGEKENLRRRGVQVLEKGVRLEFRRLKEGLEGRGDPVKGGVMADGEGN